MRVRGVGRWEEEACDGGVGHGGEGGEKDRKMATAQSDSEGGWWGGEC